jgi:pyruvate/2-oxoglutarate/acetoin dehydrogenase E1 component
MSESLFGELAAPVLRVGAGFAPVPHSPVLLDALTPGAADIERSVRAAMRPGRAG